MSVTTAGRLRDTRRAASWTQAKLAERVGVARRQVSRWEHDARPAPDAARSLAWALEVPRDFFVDPAKERIR